MSERPVFCPHCGAKIEEESGAFCRICGTQLVNIGGKPGALDRRAVVTTKDKMKNNVYADMSSVGYSTWWQTYGLERKIVTAAMWICALLAFGGVGSIMLTGRILRGIILFFVGFIGMFVTAGISSLRPQNREQIRENGVAYKGHVKYRRNPFTGKMVDESTLDIHHVHQDAEAEGLPEDLANEEQE